MSAELTNRELITFCDQLYLVLHAGISALEGIAILRDDAKTPEAEKLLDEIYQEFEMTGNLTEALRSSGAFPAHMLHMTALGEQTGKLDEVLAALVSYYEREESIAASIKNAVTYPAIMLLIILAVVIVLVTKVMPVFANVFAQMGVSMNGLSAGILRLGTALNRYAAVFAVILAAVVVLCLYFAAAKGGRQRLKRGVEKCVLTRETAKKAACARFAAGMALALHAGLDMDRSMELSAALVEHEELKKEIADGQKRIAEGCDFAEAMAQAGIFNGIQAGMLRIGFRTGAMDEVMEKVSVQYADEVDLRIQNMLSLLEPTLVAILSVVVGIILLSVMLPLAGIMSSLGA